MKKRRTSKRRWIWNEALTARVLGCDKHEVRRLKAAGKLRPIITKNKQWFDARQVVRLVIRRGQQSAGTIFKLPPLPARGTRCVYKHVYLLGELTPLKMLCALDIVSADPALREQLDANMDRHIALLKRQGARRKATAAKTPGGR